MVISANQKEPNFLSANQKAGPALSANQKTLTFAAQNSKVKSARGPPRRNTLPFPIYITHSRKRTSYHSEKYKKI